MLPVRKKADQDNSNRRPSFNHKTSLQTAHTNVNVNVKSSKKLTNLSFKSSMNQCLNNSF